MWYSKCSNTNNIFLNPTAIRTTRKDKLVFTLYVHTKVCISLQEGGARSYWSKCCFWNHIITWSRRACLFKPNGAFNVAFKHRLYIKDELPGLKIQTNPKFFYWLFMLLCSVFAHSIHLRSNWTVCGPLNKNVFHSMLRKVQKLTHFLLYYTINLHSLF